MPAADFENFNQRLHSGAENEAKNADFSHFCAIFLHKTRHFHPMQPHGCRFSSWPRTLPVSGDNRTARRQRFPRDCNYLRAFNDLCSLGQMGSLPEAGKAALKSGFT